ncbi:hypothetical protein [Mesorhizobium sp.]|nr:hypothetical protein [Mesorhizobium sp.]
MVKLYRSQIVSLHDKFELSRLRESDLEALDIILSDLAGGI